MFRRPAKAEERHRNGTRRVTRALRAAPSAEEQNTPRLNSLELRFSASGPFGVLEEIVVGYTDGPPQRRVRGTHWKSNARTDALAAALALLTLRDAPALLSADNGETEARLCARLHDLWFSPRKRVESHWLDAVFDRGTETLPSPLAVVLSRSGRRETASFRLAEGISTMQVRFTRDGRACDAGTLWDFLARNFGVQRPLSESSARLPIYRTSLLGREADLEQLAQLVREKRLLTLVGPSGVGKTRLAVELTARVEGITGCAYLADLSAARSREQAMQRMRDAMSATPGEARSIEELVRDRRMLLILDNCETVLEAAADIADTILRSSREVSVVATSLEPLAAHGEHCYRVQPLALPSRTGPPSEVRRASAVMLFLDRATAAGESSAATSELDLHGILSICESVGGLPLGIELAATAARRFSLADVGKLLLAHLDLVGGGDRTRPARHASLQTLFTWSYALLSELEQRVFTCLSVFPYDWSVESATVLWRAIGIDLDVALRAHAHLVDLSMVQPRMRARFTMLPSLRAFAHASLASSSLSKPIERAFEAHFLALAEARGGMDHPSAGADSDWIARLSTEASNLRHAVLLACDREEAALVARCIDALYPFWLASGAWSDGRELCHRALALPDLEPEIEEHILLAAAGLEYRLGDVERARTHYEAARRLAIGVRTLTLAHAVHGLGAVAYRTGRFEEAEDYFTQAAAIWTERGDDRNLLHVTNNLAAIAAALGRLQQAGERFESVAELAARAGDRRILASALMNVGLVRWREEKRDAAREYFERSLDIFQSVNDEWGEANVCNSLAVLSLDEGLREQCAAYHARSLAIRVKLSDRAGIVASLEGIAGHAAATQQPGRALRLLAAARTLRAATRLELTADNRRAVEHAFAAARGQLSPAAAATEEQIGASLTLEEAVELAVSD